jgi:hypothetical protein
MMKYIYQSEKLSAARRCLMLPHSRGVEFSIADAFGECTHAFHRMDENGLDDSARSWVAKIKEFMDTTAEGNWVIKARLLSTDRQIELSHVVDELAHWFERKFWEREPA